MSVFDSKEFILRENEFFDNPVNCVKYAAVLQKYPPRYFKYSVKTVWELLVFACFLQSRNRNYMFRISRTKYAYIINLNLMNAMVLFSAYESTDSKEEKKKLKLEIKNTEESVNAMKIAMKSMNKFRSAFQVGLDAE